MVNGLIGKKIGMTQVFLEDGRSVPVTVLQLGPCVVVQRKTNERDGYEAAQLGLIEDTPKRHPNKPTQGHFAKAKVPPTRVLREFAVLEGENPTPGDMITCEIFKAGERVEVSGKNKGRGFQGVMKRHNFGGGRATHGSMFHRAPGSIGQSAYPARVFKGMRMPGQMGDKRITTKGIEVIEVDAAKNLLIVKGSVPGARGSLVMVRRGSAG